MNMDLLKYWPVILFVMVTGLPTAFGGYWKIQANAEGIDTVTDQIKALALEDRDINREINELSRGDDKQAAALTLLATQLRAEINAARLEQKASSAEQARTLNQILQAVKP